MACQKVRDQKRVTFRANRFVKGKANRKSVIFYELKVSQKIRNLGEWYYLSRISLKKQKSILFWGHSASEMIRNPKKPIISWAGGRANDTQSQELELSGSHFGQKPKKHIILRPIGQPNDTQSEKAYHFMSWRPCNWYAITEMEI